ncbi:hypothetical protein pqer_cds_322 [Pandoravirus quercus]|uniref:Ankyrin repeat domain containing protein n=2 Tax=Pandoravirus TaxID=2060084 RepID=A0A2U7U8I5_9VIRU|nr:hypothetical protein pqer_cds_322 [Pandoravirus quercus]AVK74744.1 hypothetical protein pqer_cds_322 [Pandoravirus quercus]QBZ80921.1 hypothetical protein pclt_cds_323 [Pandoravirus celtis]
MHSTRPPVPASQEQKSMRRRGTGEKRRCDSGTTVPSPSPAKRARATPNLRDRCTSPCSSGDAFDAALSQQSLLVDAFPDEILCAIMAHVYPTSALVHAGSACRRFHQASAFVRAHRSAARRRTGPHADPIGCAHQLLNAISLDDPDSVVDALDTGHVSLDDLLDPVYIWSVAAHNVVARVVGVPSLASDERLDRPILERADRDPARTGYYTPLHTAILCGSVMCVRALVAMGARTSLCQVGPLVRFVAGTLAWNDIRVSHISGTLGDMDDVFYAKTHPRVPPSYVGEPGSARVDPIKLLSPIMATLPADCLGGNAGRGILLNMLAKATGRIACMRINEPVNRGTGSDCPSAADVRSAFSPCVVTDFAAAAIADFARAVDGVVEDACAFAVFLMDRGCRPYRPVQPLFSKQPAKRRDESTCGDLQERRRQGERNTERSAAVELLNILRQHPTDTHEESPETLLGAEAACFLIESLMALYDRSHPPL